eukprot:tig00000248_g21823.t1
MSGETVVMDPQDPKTIVSRDVTDADLDAVPTYATFHRNRADAEDDVEEPVPENWQELPDREIAWTKEGNLGLKGDKCEDPAGDRGTLVKTTTYTKPFTILGEVLEEGGQTLEGDAVYSATATRTIDQDYYEKRVKTFQEEKETFYAQQGKLITQQQVIADKMFLDDRTLINVTEATVKPSDIKPVFPEAPEIEQDDWEFSGRSKAQSGPTVEDRRTAPRQTSTGDVCERTKIEGTDLDFSDVTIHKPADKISLHYDHMINPQILTMCEEELSKDDAFGKGFMAAMAKHNIDMAELLDPDCDFDEPAKVVNIHDNCAVNLVAEQDFTLKWTEVEHSDWEEEVYYKGLKTYTETATYSKNDEYTKAATATRKAYFFQKGQETGKIHTYIKQTGEGAKSWVTDTRRVNEKVSDESEIIDGKWHEPSAWTMDRGSWDVDGDGNERKVGEFKPKTIRYVEQSIVEGDACYRTQFNKCPISKIDIDVSCPDNEEAMAAKVSLKGHCVDESPELFDNEHRCGEGATTGFGLDNCTEVIRTGEAFDESSLAPYNRSSTSTSTSTSGTTSGGTTSSSSTSGTTSSTSGTTSSTSGTTSSGTTSSGTTGTAAVDPNDGIPPEDLDEYTPTASERASCMKVVNTSEYQSLDSAADKLALTLKKAYADDYDYSGQGAVWDELFPGKKYVTMPEIIEATKDSQYPVLQHMGGRITGLYGGTFPRGDGTFAIGDGDANLDRWEFVDCSTNKDEDVTTSEPSTSTAPTTNTSEPTNSTEPTSTTEPTNSTEPTNTTEPTNSTEPTNTTEPTNSTEPTTNTTEPTNSTEPTNTSEPTNSSEPTTNTEPATTEPTTTEPATTEPTTTEPATTEPTTTEPATTEPTTTEPTTTEPTTTEPTTTEPAGPTAEELAAAAAELAKARTYLDNSTYKALTTPADKLAYILMYAYRERHDYVGEEDVWDALFPGKTEVTLAEVITALSSAAYPIVTRMGTRLPGVYDGSVARADGTFAVGDSDGLLDKAEFLSVATKVAAARLDEEAQTVSDSALNVVAGDAYVDTADVVVDSDEIDLVEAAGGAPADGGPAAEASA